MFESGIGMKEEGGLQPWSPESLDFFYRANVTDPAVMKRHDRMVRWLQSQLAPDGNSLWHHLRLWHESDAGAMYNASARIPANEDQAVSKWLNRRNESGAMSQGTANRMPLYKATALYGKPALQFDGVNDNLFGDNYFLDSIRSATALTSVATFVDRAQDTGSLIHFIYAFQLDGTPVWTLKTRHPAYANGIAVIRRQLDTTILSIAPLLAPATSPSVAVVQWNGATGTGGLLINGAQVGSFSTTTGAMFNTRLASDISGYGSTEGYNYLNGHIGSHMLFRCYLTPSQHAYVSAHLTYQS